MNIECGIVIEIKADTVLGDTALVESDPLSFCGSCASMDTCKVKLRGRRRKVWMKNDIKAEVGDKVKFETNPKANIILALIYYLLPVILLLIGALFFGQFSDIYDIEPDIAAAIGGVIGLILSFLIIYVFSHLFTNKGCFFPRIVDKM